MIIKQFDLISSGKLELEQSKIDFVRLTQHTKKLDKIAEYAIEQGNIERSFDIYNKLLSYYSKVYPEDPLCKHYLNNVATIMTLSNNIENYIKLKLQGAEVNLELAMKLGNDVVDKVLSVDEQVTSIITSAVAQQNSGIIDDNIENSAEQVFSLGDNSNNEDV